MAHADSELFIGGGLFNYSERDVAVDALHAATAIYTKFEVIDPLLRRIGWPTAECSLLDPACGDGAFLIRALCALDLQPNDTAALARMRGWEIHPLAVEEARVNVANQLVDMGWTRTIAIDTAERMIVQEDFLAPDVPLVEKFELVAGNPPYLRYAHLPDYFKRMYGANLPEHAKGDLLHAFLNRCCSTVTPFGTIAFITADRWLFNCSAANLREEMGRFVGIDYIARVDPTSSFYRPKDRHRGTAPRIHPVEVVLRHHSVAQSPLSREPFYPDMDTQQTTGGRTLGDICKISIGPWMGPFGIFVVDEQTAKTLPRECLVPAIDTDDFDMETGLIKRPTKFAILTEHDSCPDSVRKHLLRTMSAMPQRGIRSDGRFWIPPEKIPVSLDQPRLVIPRIARELKAVLVPPGVVPINHNLSICSVEGQDLATVRDLICCPKSQEWFRKTADRLENGYFSVKTTTLRRLPV
jgi:tRNA1(Val) A37 N6-methylase TrmN6